MWYLLLLLGILKEIHGDTLVLFPNGTTMTSTQGLKQVKSIKDTQTTIIQFDDNSTYVHSDLVDVQPLKNFIASLPNPINRVLTTNNCVSFHLSDNSIECFNCTYCVSISCRPDQFLNSGINSFSCRAQESENLVQWGNHLSVDTIPPNVSQIELFTSNVVKYENGTTWVNGFVDNAFVMGDHLLVTENDTLVGFDDQMDILFNETFLNILGVDNGDGYSIILPNGTSIVKTSSNFQLVSPPAFGAIELNQSNLFLLMDNRTVSPVNVHNVTKMTSCGFEKVVFETLDGSLLVYSSQSDSIVETISSGVPERNCVLFETPIRFLTTNANLDLLGTTLGLANKDFILKVNEIVLVDLDLQENTVSEQPTISPTVSPSESPSKSPTESPTLSPTTSPTPFPTRAPTNPTSSPTTITRTPSNSPTALGNSPGLVPTIDPSDLDSTTSNNNERSMEKTRNALIASGVSLFVLLVGASIYFFKFIN